MLMSQRAFSGWMWKSWVFKNFADKRQSLFYLFATLLLFCTRGVVNAADTPAWVKVVLDAGINRAVTVTWEDADGVLFWNVERTCSLSSANAEVIRVTVAHLLDHRRPPINETCVYNVAACDLDGCSAKSNSTSIMVGMRPSAPPVVAAWPSQNEILSVRYLPPADAGGGAGAYAGMTGGGSSHLVIITNYRVELSLDAAFSTIAHTTESQDGGIFLQHIRAMKGRRYYIRVTAANAQGWGTPGVFAAGSVRCLSTPGPPSDLEIENAGHLALRLRWRPPLGTHFACVTGTPVKILTRKALL